MNSELPTQPKRYNLSPEASVEERMEVEKLVKIMEEFANAPKEPIGKRQPGERCGYEIQRQSLAERTTGSDARQI